MSAVIRKHEEVIEQDLLFADKELAYQMRIEELEAEVEKLKLELALLTPIEGSVQ